MGHTDESIEYAIIMLCIFLDIVGKLALAVYESG